MPRIDEAAVRRAGLLVVLAAASALMRLLPLPAAEANTRAVLLALLHAVLLLGCAAVQVAPAHRDVLRRARPRARAGLRWLGFAGVALCLYAAGDVGLRKEEAADDTVRSSLILLFPMFLTAVWAVYLSMLTGTGAPARASPAAEEEVDGGDVNGDMAPFSAAGDLVDSKV